MDVRDFSRLSVVLRLLVPALFVLALLAHGAAVHACDSPDHSGSQTDPMIKITSLPMEQNKDEVMAAISKDVSKATGINENFITYYWQTFDSIYCPGCEAVKIQKPMFVDLYVPGFMTEDERKSVMTSLAESIEKHTGYTRKDLFMHTHIAQKDQLFIMGGLVNNWKQVGGPDDSLDGDKATKGTPLREFLFKDPSFVFQSLWRFGLIASGASDLGEALTAVSMIRDGDHEDWYDAWNAMGEHTELQARTFADKGHRISAREAYKRASNYYRASGIFLSAVDPRLADSWQMNRDAFVEAAKLSEGEITPVRIPYEGATLQGYWLLPGGVQAKRPTLIIQTGLDGYVEDLYFIAATSALKRGYNCLIFEGPGQGEAIVKDKLPFRYDWEKVVTPVTDFALTLPGADPDKLGLIAYSMGGYLGSRALTREHRIAYGVVDGGVLSVFDGTMSKFPQEALTLFKDGEKNRDRINEIVTTAMDAEPDLDKFIKQMLWTFQADTPFDILHKLSMFDLKKEIGKIKAEMLVLASVDDQVAGSYEQSKLFYEALRSPKTYYEFGESEGAQFHCQLGAPMFSGEIILNWLDERMQQ